MQTTRPTAINIRQAAKKVSKPAGLTVTTATGQARRIVDRVMPGVGATVDSRNSWDVATDRQVVVTTITFPETADASDVACWAERAPGVVRSTWSTCSIVITRAV